MKETYSREEGERAGFVTIQGQRRLCTVPAQQALRGMFMSYPSLRRWRWCTGYKKEGPGERQTARPAVLKACGQEGWGVGALLSHPSMVSKDARDSM